MEFNLKPLLKKTENTVNHNCEEVREGQVYMQNLEKNTFNKIKIYFFPDKLTSLFTIFQEHWNQERNIYFISKYIKSCFLYVFKCLVG